ncbi:MAG: MerR family transcriptional regulator [Alphaproteobacteria bacterium]|nr:MerR family transcriptional regulator [Alphaproteobacteria bacterium]
MDKAPDAFRIISEVAGDLDVPQHVLRFWESRFPQIKPMKRGGGRRYYRPDDVGLLRGIRHLLYSEGYTIRGVQRILREQGVQFVQAVWQDGAPQPPRAAVEEEAAPERGRGLLGLIPGFGKAGSDRAAEDTDEAAEADHAEDTAETEYGEDEVQHDGRREPIFENAASRAAPARAAPAAAGLSREQVMQLQMALDGLGECRRLLDAAIGKTE